MKNLFFFLAVVSVLASCSSSHVDIKGEFACHDDGQMVTLERIATLKNIRIDTTYIKDNKFNFRISPAPSTPQIYNIRCGTEIIPVLVAKGDKIKLRSIGDLSVNYKIEGSEGSALIKEISTIMNTGAETLDSLYKVYVAANDPHVKAQAAKDYRSHFFKVKREQISFIVKNKGSVAAVYALYQRLPDDAELFNGANDVVYYNMVADSIAVAMPDSPYIPILKGEINKLSRRQQLEINKQSDYDATIAGFPEIELKDMFNKTQSLSSLSGKVILLSFYSPDSQSSRLDNAELKEIYAKYSDKGFEIYQVALHKDNYSWLTLVQTQKLPWISVIDTDAENSVAASKYNVKQVPAMFLIDKNSTVVARDLTLDELEDKISSLL